MLGQNIFSSIVEEEFDLLGLTAKDYESWASQPLAKEVDGYDPNLFTLFQPSEFFDAYTLKQQNMSGNPVIDDCLVPVTAATEGEPGNIPSLLPQPPLFDFYDTDQHAFEPFPLFGGGIFESEIFAAQLDKSLLEASLLPELPLPPPLLFSESARLSLASTTEGAAQKHGQTAEEQANPRTESKPDNTLKEAEQPPKKSRGKRSKTGSSDQPVRRSPRLAGKGN